MYILRELPSWLSCKESACSLGATGDAGWISGFEDALEEGMQLTAVFLPGESHGQKRLVGYSS